LEKFSNLTNNYLNALVRLGILCFHAGDLNGAQDFSSRALAVWPTAEAKGLQTRAALLENRAIALLIGSRKQEAIETLGEAIAATGPADSWDWDNYLLLETAKTPLTGLEEFKRLVQGAAENI
jgi:tetratricopeptide (TPR) repeat protein